MGVGWVIIEKLERSVEGAFLTSDGSAWRDLLTLPLVGCDLLLWGVRPLYSLTAGGIFPCMFKWVSAWKTGEEHATVCLTSDSAWKTCICMLWPNFLYSLWCKVKPYIKLRMCSVLFRPGSPGCVPWGLTSVLTNCQVCKVLAKYCTIQSAWPEWQVSAWTHTEKYKSFVFSEEI